MTIVVASGKGGTGKTTVAIGLARALPGSTALLDCDVEAPNAHLFFHDGAREREMFAVTMPRVDEERCTGCGACAEFCAFGALAVVNRQVIIIDELCHACGGCSIACPHDAIREVPHVIGSVTTERHKDLTLVTGDLNVGETLAPPLIREVKTRGGVYLRRPGTRASGTGDYVVIDAPPGTTCPVVESVRGADVAVLVTENTPFGVHDLRLAAIVCRDLGVSAGVVVNRVGVGYPDEQALKSVCEEFDLPILLRIPYSEAVASAYARGDDIVAAEPTLRAAFEELAAGLVQLAAPGVAS